MQDGSLEAGVSLFNRLAAPGELTAQTQRFADELNALAPWAVRRTRELLRAAEAVGLPEAMYSGDQVNQLLRLNGQLAPLFETPKDLGTRP